jgi:hypothetical protein
MRSGGCSAGSSRALRLDPHALPVRYAASDAAADGSVRDIELHRERVVLRRSVGGMRMALNMPLTAFNGVALRLMPGEGAVAVVLAHDDPGLVLPLHVTDEADDAFAEWHGWAEALNLPLLVEDQVGFRKAPPALGEVKASRPRPRRRRRSALKRRRPSILMRRACVRALTAMPVHRGEREIIARN